MLLSRLYLNAHLSVQRFLTPDLECDDISSEIDGLGLAEDVPPLVGDLGPVEAHTLLLVAQFQPVTSKQVTAQVMVSTDPFCVFILDT